MPNDPVGYYTTRQLTAADPEGDPIPMGLNDDWSFHWSLIGTYNGLDVQYKVGPSGTWQDSGTGYIAGSPTNTDSNTDYDPLDAHVTKLDKSNKIYFRVADTSQPDVIYAETPAYPADPTDPQDEGNEVLGYLELLEPDPTTTHLFTYGDGETTPVRWKKYGEIGNIKIELYADGQWQTAAASGLDDDYPSGTSGETGVSFGSGWLIPDIIASDCKIKLTTVDVDKPTLTSESNIAFTIQGEINSVSDPVGGLWYAGEDHTIEWSADGTMDAVEIDLIIASGEGAGTHEIASNYSGPPALQHGTNQYTWAAAHAEQFKRNDTCTIRVTSSFSGVNNETGTFTLKPKIEVTTPSSAWIAESSSNLIEWTEIEDPTSLIDIYLIDDASGFSDLLLTPAPGLDKDTNLSGGMCSYTSTVTLPAVLTASAKIKIQDHDSATLVNGESNPFDLIGGITVDEPTSAVTDWKVGDVGRKIKWTAKGDIGDVNIYADYDGTGTIEGADELLITVAASSGYNEWTWEDPGDLPDPPNEGIGDHVANDMMIKITDADAEGVTSDDSEPFDVIGGFAFEAPLNAVGHVHQIDNNSNPTDPTPMTIEWISTD
ncbi:MAG: hypothetical protein ACYSSL_01280 [Planctomycetota bacterium]|jgi:hypothetical protein